LCRRFDSVPGHHVFGHLFKFRIDNTVVGITKLDISKKAVTKIEINIFFILLSYTRFLG